MARAVVNLTGSGSALLDVVSYGRRGPGRRDRFSAAQVALIARTIHRAPEVMVKVLTRGAKELRSVGKHLKYLTRDGDLKLETDEGPHLAGEGSEKALMEDWDLALDERRPSADLRLPGERAAPKLVHKLIFSMPPGTPAEKVLDAVRTLAREEFALKHRYALVLHTDESHPHVHVVVKAMGEDGTRLNIRKETLRHWRREFARQLRERGVEANATERTARGITRVPKIDPIFRARARDRSTHYRERESDIRRELASGGLKGEPAEEQLRRARRDIQRGWMEVASTLELQSQPALAAQVRKFVQEMPLPRTEKQILAAELRARRAGKPEDPEIIR